ncbi:hypothetical protein BGZ97_004127 [Linnemannia gamsii]|uniref:Probable RNA polymerase II nuclear localization protein SLC7A6OS n=1 Tax=Linnemannia gamsii TaxID=64522 RepID=A0A9P6QX27_9FUNG|nr:hypothetical protein BGZ97_004127 [Linnemannia gamsii]
MALDNRPATLSTTTARRLPPNPAVPTPSQSTSSSASIFLRKKKPTVAHIGSRPLLRPFSNTAIDYSNPGKFDPHPVKPVSRGTAISTPGFTPSSDSSSATGSPLPIFSTGSGSVISSTTPFTFDNHTPESKPHLPTSTKTLRESPSQSFRKRAGSFDPPTTNQTNDEGLTILRIKRRRNEEPLDTLVVQEQLEKLAGKKQRKTEDESQREKENAAAGLLQLPKAAPAVFRLATTVNKELFKDPTQSSKLREKITNMAESSPRPRSRLMERHTADYDERVQERRGELAATKRQEARTARYRVINQKRSGYSTPDSKLPPKVKSSNEVAAEAQLDIFKMYDAVKEDEPKSKQQVAKEAEEADIMCNFLPMVREYLTISDSKVEPKISVDETAVSGRLSSASNRRGDTGGSSDSEDEYVYDIYYRDVNADHVKELWFSDDENNFMNEDDSSDDDYEDSDSNAEDYYQNDYPEDELSDDAHPCEC